jgi:anti-anti-sigma factor
LQNAIDGGHGPLNVDLSGVTFLDATGIRALVAAARLAGFAGRRLRVESPAPRQRRVLEIVKLDWLILSEDEQSRQPAAQWISVGRPKRAESSSP